MNRQAFCDMLLATNIIANQNIDGMSREEAMSYLRTINACLHSLIDINYRYMTEHTVRPPASFSEEEDEEDEEEDEEDTVDLTGNTDREENALGAVPMDIDSEHYTIPADQRWGSNSHELRSPEFPRTPSAARPEYFTVPMDIDSEDYNIQEDQQLNDAEEDVIPI